MKVSSKIPKDFGLPIGPRWAGWGPLGLLVASLAWLALAYVGLSLGAETLERGVGAARRWQDLQSLHREAPRADSLMREFIRMDSALQRLGRALPPGAEGGHALQILVEKAKACSLVVVKLQALEERDFSSYKELPFVLTAQGQFTQVARFLTVMDSLPWSLRLHALKARAKSLHLNRIEATLEFSVFAAQSREP